MFMARFGPSGNGELFYNLGFKDSEEAPKWLNSLGLSAYEYSFTLGRFITPEKAARMKEQAEKYNIKISVHAPYYINFCNLSETSQINNEKYVLNSLRGVKQMGGNTCVVHMGSKMKMEREEAFNNLERSFKDFLQTYYDQNFDGIHINPETMGKYNNIGTVDEILEISSWDKNIVPCFDFGHINCLTQGALKTKEDFVQIFEKAIDKIGFEKVDNCHIHFSKIKYGEKGEIAHLTLEDDVYGPNYEPFLESILDLRLHPTIISESKGTQPEDAQTMMKYFESLL